MITAETHEQKESLGESFGDGAVTVRIPFASAERGATLLTTAVAETLALDTDLSERLAVLLATSTGALMAGRERTGATRLIEIKVEVDQGPAELTVTAQERESRDSPASANGFGTGPTAAMAGLERMPDGGVRATIGLERQWAAQTSPPIRLSFDGPLFVRGVLPRALARTAEDGGSRHLEPISRIAGLGDRIATILSDARFERLRLSCARSPEGVEVRLWQLSGADANEVEAMVRRDFPEAGIKAVDGCGSHAQSNLISISMPIAMPIAATS